MINFNYLRYKCLKPFNSWRNKYLKYIANNYARRQDFYNIIAKEISEYTKESIETIKQKHKIGSEGEKNFELFKNQAALPKSKVEEFYRDCSYYIYELPLWNAERNRPKYLCSVFLPYLKKNKYKKVVDFGGGAGDLAIELAGNKLDVSYCDISEKLFDFAIWRFKNRNLTIKMIKGLCNITEAYDCIFSFDVFEHIKDLSQTLVELVNCIKPGGSLIFSGAFSGGVLHLQENEKYDEFKNIDNLMQKIGLTFQDKFAQFYFYKHQVFQKEAY